MLRPNSEIEHTLLFLGCCYVTALTGFYNLLEIILWTFRKLQVHVVNSSFSYIAVSVTGGLLVLRQKRKSLKRKSVEKVPMPKHSPTSQLSKLLVLLGGTWTVTVRDSTFQL